MELKLLNMRFIDQFLHFMVDVGFGWLYRYRYFFGGYRVFEG